MPACSRAKKVKPFLVMEVLEKAQEMQRKGTDIVHLEIGEPDFDTPEVIKDAACKAIADGHTHYTHSLGLIELREAICEDYLNRYGVEVHPDQIIVTSGTSPAMLLIFSALLEQNEGVIVSDPGYACYPNFVEFTGGRVQDVQVHEDDGFQFRESEIRARMDDTTKAILINSPSNPTGNLLSAERMQAIADLGPWVVSDEIYHGLVYEGKERSILEFTDKAFVFNGFSKLYAMTGWRLGYVIAPKAFMKELQAIAQNLFICAGSVAQWAGVAALRDAQEDVERMKEIYDQRRRLILKRIRECGLGITVEPTGAFYALANAKKFTNDSLSFAFDILEKAHVGVTPGIDFGPGAEGYIRFSYANSIENIEEGMRRLKKYFEQLG